MTHVALALDETVGSAHGLVCLSPNSNGVALSVTAEHDHKWPSSATFGQTVRAHHRLFVYVDVTGRWANGGLIINFGFE